MRSTVKRLEETACADKKKRLCGVAESMMAELAGDRSGVDTEGESNA